MRTRTAAVVCAAFILPSALSSACGDAPNGDGTTLVPDLTGAGSGSSGGAQASSGATADANAGNTRDGGGTNTGDASATTTWTLDAATTEADAALEPGSQSDAATDAEPADVDSGEPDAGGELERFVGNITTRSQVRSDFITFWDQITPENEGKWGSVEPVRDQMNWDGIDRAYQYAKTHGIPFKQHTFVWGSQQPNWIGSLSQAEQREEVEEWIRLYCERYPDTELIDVVNEPPPHTTPAYAQALGGAGSSGYDWIVQAFEWARQYCPDSILILNDYNNIEWPNDHNNFVDIVERMLAAGAPIDAIGAQAHDAYRLSNDTVKGYLDGLAATGLPIYVSEYDINVASDSEQREIMERQFPMFWEHPSVQGVTLWGYVNGATWLANTGLMSSAGSQRPAMVWLMSYLER